MTVSTALIFGRANGVWDEVKAAMRLLMHYDHVIAVGKAGVDYNGHIDHWVSFHAELFPRWVQLRERAGRSSARMLWTNVHGRRVTMEEIHLGVRQVDCMGGSSGFVAVNVARAVGANRIVLAGIPLDAERGHYDEPGTWDEAHLHRKAWENAFTELASVVRSMSGWTQQKFGAPTAQWLVS